MAYPIKHGFIAITPEISGPYTFNVEEYCSDGTTIDFNSIDNYCESLLSVLFEDKSLIKYSGVLTTSLIVELGIK